MGMDKDGSSKLSGNLVHFLEFIQISSHDYLLTLSIIFVSTTSFYFYVHFSTYCFLYSYHSLRYGGCIGIFVFCLISFLYLPILSLHLMMKFFSCDSLYSDRCLFCFFRLINSRLSGKAMQISNSYHLLIFS